MILLWFVAALLLMTCVAWVLRFAGQSYTGNAPRFRDMSLGVAFGYVLGAVLLAWVAWAFLQSRSDDPITGNKFFFVGFVVQFFIVSAALAWIFRFLGRLVGTEGSKKAFREMPLTAAYGILIILVYVVLAVFAQQLAPHGQETIIPGVAANIVPGGDPAIGGDPGFPLGTDQIGRDILSRLIYGAQNTVGIAFATTLLAFFIGGTLGFLAATFGGWLDQSLSRAVDALMAIPSIIFALLLITIAGAWFSGAGDFNLLIVSINPLTLCMIVIIAVIDSTRVFRLARAVGQNIVVMDYIEAAKLRGEGLGYLVFKEILPNAKAPLLAEFGLRFCFVFLTIASLSFLGVGIQPPLADWGTMVRESAPFINNLSIVNEPWAADMPAEFLTGMFRQASLPLLAAGAIALLTIAVNFVVDWMLHRTSGLKE